MKGWVYVISTLGMPDKVKVGFTNKDPSIRAKELNGTSSPYPHVVDYEMLVDNPRHVEIHAHRLLKDYHAGKEWFNCSAETAIMAIQNAARNHQVYLENFKRADREKIEQERERLARQQEEARKIELDKIEKQQRATEEQRLKFEKECIRKIELEKQRRIREIQDEYEAKKHIGFDTYVLLSVCLLGIIGQTIGFLIPEIRSDDTNQALRSISLVIISVVLASFIIDLIKKSDYMQRKYAKIDKEKEHLITKIKDGTMK